MQMKSSMIYTIQYPILDEGLLEKNMAAVSSGI